MNLKEIGTSDAGIMCIANGYSKINFNPRYFATPELLAKEFETGYYIKNMNAFGAGAHEAGHLIEKWLKDTRDISAREVVTGAYGAAVRARGFKTLAHLRKEICKHARRESFGECLADIVADCVINGQNATVLSQFIWRILKGEIKMIAYSEMKLVKFSDEDFERYGRFDNFGELIGVEDNALAEFKAAYEHDKKIRDDAAKKGIIL